ncbi:MAG TPA: hypothetical protein VF916_06885 [Ktedonobacterales bacterium]
MPDNNDLTRTDAASGGQDAPPMASTSAQNPQQERAPQQERVQASSDFLREGRPRPAYTTPLDMSAEMGALAALPPGAARVVARTQPTISRPAMMNGELGVFVPLSALQEAVGIAEPIEQGAADAAEGAPGETTDEEMESGPDADTQVMPEEWYQAHLARQGAVSSGQWGVDSQDFTNTGSLDPTHVARRNAGKAWRRLLRLGHPATLRQRIGGLAFAAIMIVTLLGLLAGLVLTIWLGGVAGGPPLFGRRLGVATSTAGTGGSQQPIAVPSGSAAILFTLASQMVQPNPSFALSGQPVTSSSTQSSGTIASFWVPETEADAVPAGGLALHVVNSSSGTATMSNWYPSGGGYTCIDPISFSLPPGTSQDYPCAVSVSNRSSNTTIRAHTLQGAVPGLSNVTFDQTVPLVGNGHYQVRQQDCAAATQTAHSAGAAWAQQWMSQQSLPSGDAWAFSSVQDSYANDSCPVNQYIDHFQATTMATARNVRYTPGAAVSQAAPRLDAALPSGYAWKANSKTSCTPTLSGVNGATVTVTCAVSGQAIFSWSNVMSDQLIAALAGKSATDAEAICNTAPGVARNSCHVQLGDGATAMPTETGKIKLYPTNP